MYVFVIPAGHQIDNVLAMWGGQCVTYFTISHLVNLPDLAKFWKCGAVALNPSQYIITIGPFDMLPPFDNHVLCAQFSVDSLQKKSEFSFMCYAYSWDFNVFYWGSLPPPFNQRRGHEMCSGSAKPLRSQLPPLRTCVCHSSRLALVLAIDRNCILKDFAQYSEYPTLQRNFIAHFICMFGHLHRKKGVGKKPPKKESGPSSFS